MARSWIRLLPGLIVLVCGAGTALAQLTVEEGDVYFSGFPSAPAFITVVDASGAHVKFKYAGVQAPGTYPNFVIVVPSSATTPAGVTIGLNPNAVALLTPGGAYALTVTFSTVDQNPASSSNTLVTLQLPAAPPPKVQSVLNAASLQPAFGPGTLVSIFGSNLTGPTLTTTYDDTASYPTTVAGTSVLFNGTAAPLIYVSPTQINAIMPYSLAGQSSVQVSVQRFSISSANFTAPLQDTAPAIFTANQSGTGSAASVQQPPNGPVSFNSPSNPVAAGEYVTLFATGQGVWNPPPQSDVFLIGEPLTTQPVTLTIGGQPAKIVYAGTLGQSLNSWGVLQVNAIIPSGVASGAQPVVLKIGSHDNSQQDIVIYVQ